MRATETGTARASYRSRHRVWRAPSGLPVGAAAEALFTELAACLRREHITPLQEKIYGPLAAQAAVLERRREILRRHGLDPELPCTYIAGRREEDLGLSGVQLWGVVPTGDALLRVRTVHGQGGVLGRLLESPEGRMLHLASVRGVSADGSLPGTAVAQAEQMLRNAEHCLVEHGFSFQQVVRTWIHLTRLLDWYGEFNRVRTLFLRERGITGRPGGAPFPASTGIQGCCGPEECVMDLLAVDGGGFQTRAIQASSRQQQPIAYGSSFSRGLLLAGAGEQVVFVSGTASIAASGETLHCGQREAQILETLLGVASLLEDQGASLRDLAHATLFCKDQETLAHFDRLTRQLGLPQLPVIPVLADVCRPELLVEIEAMAVVPPARWRPRRAEAAP